MPSSVLLNVVDVEATCWQGPPPPGQTNEIIEVGLTVVDIGRGERLSKHRLMVKPQNSEVSAFCTELTGITQAEADQGMPFSEACRELKAQWGSDVVPWTSWGDYDRKQFTRDCLRLGVPYPFCDDHTNAKRKFAEAYQLPRPCGMARALTIADLPLEGRHHRGDDDAWNIAALVLRLKERAAW